MTAARAVPRPPSGSQAPAGPPEPLIAVVAIAAQEIEVFGPGGSLTRSRVSTGQAGYATPTGVFSVLQRNRYHQSNIYSNAPMPYMQRLTWSGIALHQGVVPNYPASHGCIRLPAGFAETLWGMGRVGMRVIVSPTPTAPVSFRHPWLPAPVSPAPLLASSTAVVELAAAATPSGRAGTAQRSPFAAAQLRLQLATAGKAAAEKAVKPALELAAARSADAVNAAAALRASAAILADAEEQLELEQLAMASSQIEAAEAAIRDRIRVAEKGVHDAREAHDKLIAAEREASDAAFAAARAAREAETAIATTAEELRLARRAVEPVTAFISRKTGQVHVRQGFQELHEGPIGIADPGRPLGTHVFTAMAEEADGASLRWLAVSMPTSGGDQPKRRKGEAAPEGLPASAAGEALDRLELPADVRKLLAERLWPGASVIVSDYGLGETGEHTDFVILTR